MRVFRVARRVQGTHTAGVHLIEVRTHFQGARRMGRAHIFVEWYAHRCGGTITLVSAVGM